jgi:quinol monooxygenase YgiN
MKHRIARFKVDPRRLADARRAISSFIEAVGRLEPGTLAYEAFQEPEGVFLHFMTFESEAAESLHRSTPHVRRFVDELYPLCVEKPLFTELTSVAEVRRGRSS